MADDHTAPDSVYLRGLKGPGQADPRIHGIDGAAIAALTVRVEGLERKVAELESLAGGDPHFVADLVGRLDRLERVAATVALVDGKKILDLGAGQRFEVVELQHEGQVK